MKKFGLFFIFSAVSASYNLYLNEHETMRLLGKLAIINQFKLLLVYRRNGNFQLPGIRAWGL